VNLFGYVRNNSVNKKDPLGLFDPGTWAGVGAGAGTTTGGGLTIGGVAAGGAVIIGGFAAGYAIGYYPGQWIANHPSNPFVHGPLNPFGNPNPSPQTKPDESCDTKPKVEPKPKPQLSHTPRPFPPPNEPKRTCTKNGELNLPNGKKRCMYKCSGGGFPGFYIIGTTVNADESCPDPDKNDNDWVPGGS
jgi:hypothetical protein